MSVLVPAGPVASTVPGSEAPPPVPPADVARVDELERMLSELVAAMVPDPVALARHGRGRPRILPALALWAGLVLCVLRGLTSQQALWRLLASKGLWHFPPIPVSDQAVSKRLAQTGDDAALAQFFADLTTVLVARVERYADHDLAAFAAEVVAIDETTLDPVARRLPALHGVPPGDAALLPGKLAGRFDLRRQLWQHLADQPAAQQNEKVAARDLVADLPKQSLLLFDLGDCAFAWFDDLSDGEYFWISRLRAKTSYELLHVCYQDGETLDALVWLGAYRADRAKHAVRLVQYRHGPVLYRYLTNVTDPGQLALADIARLYARRWDIEMAVNLVKTHLGLHLLWSAKPAVIRHQVWAVLIIAQVLQALRVEIAGQARVGVFEVSMPLLIAYLPQYAARGLDPIAAFLADAHTLGFIRRSRRTEIHAPHIPAQDLSPPPPDLIRLRTSRYAHRNCGPRAAREN